MKKSFCLLAACMLLASAGFAQKPNTLTHKEKKKGWVLLFDGTTTNGWTTVGAKPVPAGWEIHDGSITAKKGGHGGDIITVNEYSNFDLSVDFNIEPGTNSGVKYFFIKYEKGGWLGMEYQIIDDKGWPGKLEPWQHTGCNYAMQVPATIPVKPVGQWNTTKIVVKGAHVEHWLNGKKILEYQLWSPEWEKQKASGKWKDHPGYGMNKTGHIALQYHGGDVWFRDIKLKKLSAKS